MKALFVIFIIILLLGLLSFYIYKESISYNVTRYKINSDKILKDKIKIAFISDLHNTEHGEKNILLYNDIEKYDPNLIIFAGDMITACLDANYDYSNTLEFIASLAKKWPVYYGVGNHEERLNRKRDKFLDAYDDLSGKLDEINAPLILNEKISINEDGIDIYGLNLEHEYFRKFVTKDLPDNYLKNIFGDVDKSKFSILIAHNPEHFKKYADFGPDLVLSGHVHGGIIGLPFVGGVISPALKLFPKYDAGEFNIGSTKMILSRGAGNHTVPIRFNNRQEIIFIDILR